MKIRERLGAIVATTLCLLATACSDDPSSSGGESLECPGVNGTYYFAFMPTGECAAQGPSLVDTGVVVQDHGVLLGSSSGCSTSVTYDGCTVKTHSTCAAGVTVDSTQTFAPGSPGEVSGSQVQTLEGGGSCTFEIYGSTDLAAVHEHAGLTDVGDTSSLSTPSTPAPDQAPAAINSSATTGLSAVCQTTACAPYSRIDHSLSTTWYR